MIIIMIIGTIEVGIQQSVEMLVIELMVMEGKIKINNRINNRINISINNNNNNNRLTHHQ